MDFANSFPIKYFGRGNLRNVGSLLTINIMDPMSLPLVHIFDLISSSLYSLLDSCQFYKVVYFNVPEQYLRVSFISYSEEFLEAPMF